MFRSLISLFVMLFVGVMGSRLVSGWFAQPDVLAYASNVNREPSYTLVDTRTRHRFEYVYPIQSRIYSLAIPSEQQLFAVTHKRGLVKIRTVPPHQESFSVVYLGGAPNLSHWVAADALLYVTSEGVHVLDTQRKTTQQLYQGDVRSADLSPDQTQIVYTTGRGLFLVDTQTGNETTLQQSFRDNPIYSEPRFSPDGEAVVYVSNTWEPDKRGIFVMDLESRQARKITDSTFGSVNRPVWSPDGRTVAFQHVRSEGSEIYLFDLQTGKRKLIERTFLASKLEWLR